MSLNTLQVCIPAGITAGDSLNIQAPDGRMFGIVVPAGVAPGELISVDIREATGGGSTVLVINQDQNSRTITTDSQQLEESNKSKAALGAAVVGAAVGTLLIGPITGPLLIA